jgi:hypothetical protein
MITYMYSHLAFYVLLVSYGGPEYGYRISGGYDSCLVASHTLTQYDRNARVRCMSGIEWDKAKPGLRSEVEGP